MVMMKKFVSMFLVATAMVFLMSMQQYEGGRVLNGDGKLLLGSLAGSSKTPTPNPGTLIPHSKTTTINGKNFAGHIRSPPPPHASSLTMQEVLFGMLIARR